MSLLPAYSEEELSFSQGTDIHKKRRTEQEFQKKLELPHILPHFGSSALKPPKFHLQGDFQAALALAGTLRFLKEKFQL